MTPSQQAAYDARMDMMFDALIKMMMSDLDPIHTVRSQVEKIENAKAHLPVIPCFCKKEFPMNEMHKCLYCGAYFCVPCAEEHFGQTREEFHAGY